MPEDKKPETLADQINHQTFITWLLNYSNVPNSQMDFLGYALNSANTRDEFMRSVVMNLQDPQQIDAISDALDQARYAKLTQTKASR
jgi:hypothetical protein